jgi:hypothetical protein
MAKPKAERLRIVIVDCSNLTGVDPTAANTLVKARRLIVDECSMLLVWCAPTANMVPSLPLTPFSPQCPLTAC